MKISNIVASLKLVAPFDIAYLHWNIPETLKDPNIHWLKYRVPENNSYIVLPIRKISCHCEIVRPDRSECQPGFGEP